MANSVVAIVGRPNVGKSALLNRLIRRRVAIVEETPGVTRDRIYQETYWNGKNFVLVDTGGILLNDPDTLRNKIRMQVFSALDEADLILFVVDVMEGLNPLDQDVADLLRGWDKEVILVANKADNQEIAQNAVEFYALGMGEPFVVSAIHGTGTGDLLDAIVEKLPEDKEEKREDVGIKLAIVGRPNVGKSSILNCLVGEERAIVTDVPGTTRDAIDAKFQWEDTSFVVVDTAGLRRKSKVEENIEFYSTRRAFGAIKRCDVGILVLDAEEPAVMQDMRIAGKLEEEGKGIIIVVNKWDKVCKAYKGEKAQQKKEEMIEKIRDKMDFIAYAPIIFTSAVKGWGIGDIPKVAMRVFENTQKTVPTRHLNQIFRDAIFFRPPPSWKGDNLKIYYVHQKGVMPPTFVFKVNSPNLVHFSYLRYLENQLRMRVDLEGSPVKFVFKK